MHELAMLLLHARPGAGGNAAFRSQSGRATSSRTIVGPVDQRTLSVGRGGTAARALM